MHAMTGMSGMSGMVQRLLNVIASANILGKSSLAEAASGVAITSHTLSGPGATGGAFMLPSGVTHPMVSLTSGAGFRGVAGQAAHAVQLGSFGAPADTVSVTVTFSDTSAVAGPFLQTQAAVGHGYFVDRNIAAAWKLYKTNGSSNQVIGSIGASFSTGVPYTVTISRSVSGSVATLTVTINGTAYGPFTDDGSVLGSAYNGVMIGGLLSYDAASVTYTNYLRTGRVFLPWNVYGDSNAVGYGAGTNWPAILQNSGIYNNSYAVSGDQSLDAAELAYLHSPGRTLLAIGTNDQRTGGYGSNVTKRGYATAGVRATILWNTLPTKTYAQQATTSGSWSNTIVYGGTIGRNTSSNGATLTFTASGDVIYVGYTIANTATGTWKVTVDGVDRATGSSDGTGCTTANGQDYGPQAIRISGLGSGTHTIVFQSTNTGGVYCDWVAGIGDQTTTNRVYVANVLSPNATGFASFGVDETNVLAYCTDFASVVSALAGDGLPVTLVDIHALTPTYQADGIHLLDADHQLVANKFTAAGVAA